MIVDSSKNASFAFALRACAGLDLRVIHLVRDSRAVAYSWTRKVRRPETAVPSYMTTVEPASAAWQWDYQNGPCSCLPGSAPDAPGALRGSRDRPGADTGPRRGVHEPAVGLRAARIRRPRRKRRWAELYFSFGVGQPLRFAAGRIPIRLDDEWRTAMSKVQRRKVTAITLPLLARYGYL